MAPSLRKRMVEEVLGRTGFCTTFEEELYDDQPYPPPG